MPKLFFISCLLCLFFSSCFLSMHHKQKPALVKNVNIDESLKISKDEMQKKGIGQGLGIWVLRDQIVTPAQAHMISDLYLNHIDSMRSDFIIWHSSWGIANLYRLGNDSVKAELETAYQKAKKQPGRMIKQKKIADAHINGTRLVTGFIHAGGRSYAHRHLVVPGNRKYLQSYQEYLSKERK
jgi:hypothetical protein